MTRSTIDEESQRIFRDALVAFETADANQGGDAAAAHAAIGAASAAVTALIEAAHREHEDLRVAA